MMLEHLDNHELQTCRLVCKRWCEASRQLPVNLRPNSLERLLQSSIAYPNAVSVSATLYRETMAAPYFFNILSSVPNLEFLRIEVCERTPLEPMQQCFQLLPRLTDLSIVVNTEYNADKVIASIVHLTNLTKLHIDCFRPQAPLKRPLVELEKVEHLQITFDLFTDEHGTCLFPSLTKLTRLELVSPEIPGVHFLTTQVGSWLSGILY